MPQSSTNEQSQTPDAIAEADASAPPKNDASRDRSPRELRLAKLKRNAWIAGCLVVVWVLVVAWSSGALQHEDQPELLDIAPSARFEDLCRRVGENERKLLEERETSRLDENELHLLEESAGKLHVHDYQITDAMIPQITQLDSIETLIIDQGILTDRSIDVIAALPKLRHLRLRHSPITDEGLKTLAQCDSLWYINLPHAQCTHEGVAALAQIPHLRQLRLGSPELGNDVARAIVSIKSLRSLHLIGVPVTDEGLKTIAEQLPFLESLYLDDSAVTETGWNWLFDQHAHLHVHVDQNHHDRDPNRHAHHD